MNTITTTTEKKWWHGTGRYILGFVALYFIAGAIFQEPQVVLDVQSGKKSLECKFSDGWRLVDADKVVGLDDQSNRWIFTNGSAGTCEVF